MFQNGFPGNGRSVSAVLMELTRRMQTSNMLKRNRINTGYYWKR